MRTKDDHQDNMFTCLQVYMYYNTCLQVHIHVYMYYNTCLHIYIQVYMYFNI